MVEKRKTIAFQVDRNGIPIQAGSDIVAVLNISVSDTDWTEVKTPVGVDIKALVARMRAGGGFRIAISATGTTYYTVGSGGEVALALVKGDDETIFFAQADVAGTMEVLLVR